jgi:hypothetical protein
MVQKSSKRSIALSIQTGLICNYGIVTNFSKRTQVQIREKALRHYGPNPVFSRIVLEKQILSVKPVKLGYLASHKELRGIASKITEFGVVQTPHSTLARQAHNRSNEIDFVIYRGSH